MRPLLGLIPALFYCTSALILASTSAATPCAVQGESPDDRYQFLVSLCDSKEWQLAAREAQRFLAEFPRHAKADLARYRGATALFELGSKAEARELYAQLALRSEFEFLAEVLFRLGQCELALGRPAQAAAAFERVRAMPQSYLVLAADFFLGEANFAAGEFEAAQVSYTRVLGKQGGEDYARDARYGLAWCAFRLKRYDDVAARVEDFLRAHPRDAVAGELQYLLGEARLAAGRPRDALAAFAKVSGGAHHERALRGAAFATAELGDHRAAAQAFESLLQRFPDGEFVREAALHAGIERVRAGESAAGLAALQRAATDAEGRYWLARALLDTRDAAAALAAIDTALSERPAQELAERLHVLRGDALAELGRHDEAARAYSRSQSDYALYAAAVAAFNVARLDDAARLARTLLERFPNSDYAAEMRVIVGEAQLAAQRFDEAAAQFDAAAGSARDGALRARANSRGAWCRFLSGDFAAAAERFETLADDEQAGAQRAEARYMLGRSRERLGQSEPAIAAWRAYLRQDAEGPHAADALTGLVRLDTSNAERWSAELLRRFPDAPATAEALWDVAERHAESERHADAQRNYRALIERFPGHPRASSARYALAWSAYNAGEFATARSELEVLAARGDLEVGLQRSALELLVWVLDGLEEREAVVATHARLAKLGAEPRKLLGTARLAGAALSERGQIQEARAVFDDVLSKARGDRALQAEVLIETAWLAIQAKDSDDAEAAVRTAWKLAPSGAAKPALAEATFFAGELCFDAALDARAAELYRVAAESGSESIRARALYKQGFVHLRAERFADAAPLFQRVADEFARHELAGESLYLAGDCHTRLCAWEPAASLLSRFVSEFPRHQSLPKALFRLGRAQGERGAWKECEAALAELARRAPEFEQQSEADVWRGRAALARGDTRAAKAAFERVVAKDRALPGAQARLELGGLASRAGDHEGALAHFLKVALLYEKGDVVAEASLRAAGELEVLGTLDKAKARYREVLEQYADSPFAARARQRLAELGR